MEAAERVPVGYVRRAHGVRGAVIVIPLTDRPADRFVEGARFLTDEDPPRSLQVASSAVRTDDVLVTFVDVDDRDAAAGLRGVSLTIDRSELRTLGEDEYWPEQLVGCAVLDRAGEYLGEVVEVASGGAQNRLVIQRSSGGTAEIPFVGELVPEVDLEERRIVVAPPPGLL